MKQQYADGDELYGNREIPDRYSKRNAHPLDKIGVIRIKDQHRKHWQGGDKGNPRQNT